MKSSRQNGRLLYWPKYENQTLEAFVAGSRLYAKFDCPVARQSFSLLVPAHDCETGLLFFKVRYYAQALAPRGITVNALIPGYVLSDAWHAMTASMGGVESEGVKKKVHNTPMQRFGDGREFGQVVSFMCSPRASFITGVALPVDGGLHLQ